jgi:hypothetical protein
MAKAFPFVFFLFFSLSLRAQPAADRKAILQVMDAQTQAWNTGNLDQFMQGYWQSDSLKFIGSGALPTAGRTPWTGTASVTRPGGAGHPPLRNLDRGDLTSKDAAFVIGRFFLTRPSRATPRATFTLLWRKINGPVEIVVDATSYKQCRTSLL